MRTWSHLRKKSLMGKFIFYAVRINFIVPRKLLENNELPSNFRHCERISNIFLDSEFLVSITSAISFNQFGGNTLSRLRNTTAVKKGCEKNEYPIGRSIFEFNFFSSHEGCKSPSSNKVEKLNRYIVYVHFKIEGRFLLKERTAKSTSKMHTF